MRRRIEHYLKAAAQLKFHELLYYCLYQFQLKTGLFHFLTPTKSKNNNLNAFCFKPADFEIFPQNIGQKLAKNLQKKVIEQANSICGGKSLNYGCLETGINLSPPTALMHWSAPKSARTYGGNIDIKDVWEPARFMWSIKLAQAYQLTGRAKYAQFFFKQVAHFNQENPLNKGQNWESAQEVGLRLIAWVIAAITFGGAESSHSDKHERLCRRIADHADRIFPTLSYAIAQNNNHLISEAVALYTAGTFLPYHPRSNMWKKTGRKWFNRAIHLQINNNGKYIQSSNNYHRMMLMLSIWMLKMQAFNRETPQPAVIEKLKKASQWLYDELDHISGRVPNYGHNDGSLVLPFSESTYEDYRPILQAAFIAFHNKRCLATGPWDDLFLWLGFSAEDKYLSQDQSPQRINKLRIGDLSSWAIIRADQHKARPAHADQLHIDLWYQGHNITLDPGTFRYNFSPPWDNSLSQTFVHNTISINDKNQMARAGTFLWLDWAQANILSEKDNQICASHNGYQEENIIHRRSLKRLSMDDWQVTDELLPLRPSDIKPTTYALHWLLPDWEFETDNHTITFSAPFGKIIVKIEIHDSPENGILNIIKAGRLVYGNNKKHPKIFGWISPTYALKRPATSLLFLLKEKPPITMITSFAILPNKQR